MPGINFVREHTFWLFVNQTYRFSFFAALALNWSRVLPPHMGNISIHMRAAGNIAERCAFVRNCAVQLVCGHGFVRLDPCRADPRGAVELAGEARPGTGQRDQAGHRHRHRLVRGAALR